MTENWTSQIQGLASEDIITKYESKELSGKKLLQVAIGVVHKLR